MLLGHYGLALASKRAAPDASLGLFAFAAQWLDLLWPILLIAGLEQVRIVPGLMAANPLDFVHYPISHSLLMAVVWAVLLGAFYLMARRNRRVALLVAALVASHWILDFVTHRPDLPLWPGSTRVGLGLWNSVAATIAIELAIFGAGLALYASRTRARDAIGRWALAAMVALLLLIFFSGFVSPPPPSPQAVAYVTLGLWLFAPWAHWIDRHRELKTGS